jgi:hypothetical protein
MYAFGMCEAAFGIDKTQKPLKMVAIRLSHGDASSS